MGEKKDIIPPPPLILLSPPFVKGERGGLKGGFDGRFLDEYA